MIPDDEYIQLYAMFDELLKSTAAAGEQRVVYYQPELFIEMAKEIIALRRRILQLQHLELEYRIKADECIRYIDIVNSVRSECFRKHIKLDTKLDIRSHKKAMS